MKNERAICVFGDSITIQYLPYLGEFFPGVTIETRGGTAEALADLDNPLGANCGDSSMMLAFLLSEFSNPMPVPDLIAINCGLHDIKTDPLTHKKKVDADTYGKNISQIFTFLKARVDSVVWINSTPVCDQRHATLCQHFSRFGRDVVYYNSIAESIAKKYQIPVVDLHGFTAGIGGEIYCDHVHFVPWVRRSQARWVAEAISSFVQVKLTSESKPFNSPAIHED